MLAEDTLESHVADASKTGFLNLVNCGALLVRSPISCFQSANVTFINLVLCGMGDTKCLELCDALAMSPSLRGIDLGSNKLGPAAAVGIATLIRFSQHLEYLSVTLNPLLDDGCTRLFDALSMWHGLRCLAADGCKMSPKSALVMATMLKRTTLHSLTISGNDVGASWSAVAESLESNCHLQIFVASSANLSDTDSAMAVCSMIENNSFLRSLTLDFAPALCEQHQRLATSLGNCSLLHFRMQGPPGQGVKLGSEGGKCIAEALKKNKSLTALEIPYHNVGEDALRLILESSVRLFCIDVRGHGCVSNVSSSIYEKVLPALPCLSAALSSYETSTAATRRSQERVASFIAALRQGNALEVSRFLEEGINTWDVIATPVEGTKLVYSENVIQLPLRMYHKAVLSVLLNSSLTSWQVWRFGHGAGILDHGPAIIELQRVCGDCSDFSVIVRRKTLQTVAAFDFLAENEDELSLHAGEKVQVMGFVNDDWANVQNLHGDHGVVPQSYLESFQ